MPSRAPVENPPFTLSQLKKAIPSHCFKPSILRSFTYLAHDLISLFVQYYIATNYINLLPKPLTYIAWSAYAYLQACIFSGMWVMGHECGHNAFSDYKWLDDAIGLILHTFLLVPYFSIKYSHRRHHSNTNSMDKDELFVPKREQWINKNLNNPFGRVVVLSFLITLGLPMYYLFNVTGRKYERFASQFDPFGPIFTDRERVQVFVSDVTILVMVYGLLRMVVYKGLTWVIKVYVAPLMVMNGILLIITFLNHSHSSIPHYESSNWDWLRGALATMDRDYGIMFNWVLHEAPSTHVVHHLFPTIPHYHAREATLAIKPILGKYYMADETPMWKAFWREVKECVYVEVDKGQQGEGVLWYTNKP